MRQACPFDPFYYLNNFEVVLRSMLDRYGDLLSEYESEFISRFLLTSQTSRALLVRMVMRRGNLFRESKLVYAEIGETRAAARALVEAGWVNDRPRLDIVQLAKLLTKSELIKAAGLSRRHCNWKKADLIAMLGAQCQAPREFSHWCPGFSPEAAYLLSVAPLCERFRLMFFGNHRQSWTEFITSELGVFRYESIDRHSHSRPFQTRAQIDAFERLHECRLLFHAGMPAPDLLSLVPEPIETSEWLEEARQRLLFSIARELERSGIGDTALSLYMHCAHRGARTRAIRLNSRARNWEAVGELCMRALENPESDAEYQHARRASVRLQRKLNISLATGADPAVIPQFDLVLQGPANLGAVEYQVRDHFSSELADTRTVRYVENSLINSLFGLLCWRAVFAPVPGAFFHEFHRGPADLTSTGFYRRRKCEFAKCLALLETGDYQRHIWRTFEDKWGLETPFVKWHSLDRELLGWALECFPAAHLRWWCEWILRDVQQNRTGFPDLVQFWPAARQYRMIEVKGPGDRVQDNQRRLLEYCASHHMPIAVCHARWSS